jgi:hypothetical protein
MLLNLVLRPLDVELENLSVSNGWTYTRYVDDICISGEESIIPRARAVEEAIASQHFTVRTDKRRDWGPDDPHTVTGIVVGMSLGPEPEFLEELVKTIISASPSELQRLQASLSSRIAWVRRLDRALGNLLVDALREAQLTAKMSVA